MSGPLAGVRVVELGFWVAGPSAAAVLADWGADVVKIEPPTGDPFRGLYLAVAGAEVPANPALRARQPRQAQRRPRPAARTRGAIWRSPSSTAPTSSSPTCGRRSSPALGLDWPELDGAQPAARVRPRHRLRRARAGRDRPSYDIGAFWSRAGIAAALTPPGGEPPYQRGAMGDHTAGMTLAGGISAALLARERTGRGQLVTTSLLRVGVYVLGWDTNAALRLGIAATPITRTTTPNPVINLYRAGDERWFWLLGLQGQRHWPDLVRAVDRPELARGRALRDHARPARERRRRWSRCSTRYSPAAPLAEWGAMRSIAPACGGRRCRRSTEVPADPQVRAAGRLRRGARSPRATRRAASRPPVDFSGTPWAPRAPTPECGQHTEEVLLELGYDWEAHRCAEGPRRVGVRIRGAAAALPWRRTAPRVRAPQPPRPTSPPNAGPPPPLETSRHTARCRRCSARGDWEWRAIARALTGNGRSQRGTRGTTVRVLVRRSSARSDQHFNLFRCVRSPSHCGTCVARARRQARDGQPSASVRMDTSPEGRCMLAVGSLVDLGLRRLAQAVFRHFCIARRGEFGNRLWFRPSEYRPTRMLGVSHLVPTVSSRGMRFFALRVSCQTLAGRS